MRCFKYSFCNSVYSRCLKSFSGFANILLQIPVKMGNKAKKVLSPLYSLQIIFLWSSKILYCVCLVCFLSPFFFFFFLHMVIFTTLFRRCLTLFNSTLKYTTLFQRCWMLQISTLTYATLIQRWFDVVRRRDVIST